jgi:hypothetical protein
MEYITVTATNASGTVASNALVVISGDGIVEFTKFTFQHFKSSVGVIQLSGPGLLLLDEITVTNITYSGSGSLVYSTGGSTSTADITITRSNFSSIDSTGLNGSVINVNGVVSSISVYNSSFGEAISSGNGGAFYILNCFNIIINASNFTGCSAAGGNGGAIFFGEGSWFLLDGCVFGNCSALYGGAIYSNSEVLGLRLINNVNFTNNSVGTGGNGNDIADNSSVGINLYSLLSVTNSISNSTNSTQVSNFYIMQYALSMDCLLSSGCGNDPTFVSPTGEDSPLCGSSTSPCHSLGQGVENLIEASDKNAEISVASGSYTDTVLTVYSMTLVITTNSATRPDLSLVTPPPGLFWKFSLKVK